MYVQAPLLHHTGSKRGGIFAQINDICVHKKNSNLCPIIIQNVCIFASDFYRIIG